PFGEDTINPAYQIARSLPTKHRIPGLPPIILHGHPRPITVSYAHVREIIPELLFPKVGLKPRYDIVLNIGLAPGRNFYSLETLAHRDGYNQRDEDGRTMEGDTFWRIVLKAPERLHTSFDTYDVYRRWKSGLMNVDLRHSNNAGHYLCDFMYYACMLEYWRREPRGQRPCMFLHVPSGLEEEDIHRGREAALGLISALVASDMAEERSKKAEGVMEETEWDRAADDECS
ncbi:MAG: hypothetical protein Q9175_005306, partial [Cornicularia normoerica]